MQLATTSTGCSSLWCSCPAGSDFGFAGNVTSNTFIDSNINIDFSQGPPIVTNPFFGSGVQTISKTNSGSNFTVIPAITFTEGRELELLPQLPYVSPVEPQWRCGLSGRRSMFYNRRYQWCSIYNHIHHRQCIVVSAVVPHREI